MPAAASPSFCATRRFAREDDKSARADRRINIRSIARTLPFIAKGLIVT
jgi:hypothetical protein